MPDAKLKRFRVRQSVRGLRYGELVDVDPKHQHWSDLIDRGVLVEVDQQPAPPAPPAAARQAIPDAPEEGKPKRDRSRDRKKDGGPGPAPGSPSAFLGAGS